jgi:hypothetical protein
MVDLIQYLQLDTADNMYYYFIPEGFPIFRGDTSIDANSFYFLANTPFFFGTNVEEVETYGIVFEFKTTQEYKLLAIDNFETLQMLYKKAADYPDIQQILKRNYGYDISGIKIRDSIAEKDITLSKWLCEKGYFGYAINKMKTELGIFHQEIMICNAETVQLVKQITTDKKKIQKLVDKKKMVDMGKSLDMKRKKPSQDDQVPFNYDIPSMPNYDSPPITPKKINFGFGGKRRKSRRTKQKGRSKRTSKTKRKTKTRTRKI